MGFLKARQKTVQVAGERGSVQVCELENQDVLKAAFGDLRPHQELLYFATLVAVPPDQLMTTPIEVWVTGVRIGYVDECESPRYWRQMREMHVRVSCGCLLRTDGSSSVIWVRLSLPVTL